MSRPARMPRSIRLTELADSRRMRRRPGDPEGFDGLDRRVLGGEEVAGRRVAAAGHWSWERCRVVAERARLVAAVTVSGGDLILVIRGRG
jgi:hypothetical protein